MDLTPQTLREVEFREKLRGYHPDDVDDFLEEVAVAVGALLARLDAAETGAPAPGPLAAGPLAAGPLAPGRPAAGSPAAGPLAAGPLAAGSLSPAAASPVWPGPAELASHVPQADAPSNDALRRTLVLAQRTADLAISEAEATARQIVARAQEDADRQRKEADARVAEMLEDGRRQVDAVVGDLEARRAALEREVASLHAWASQHRDRIRDALNEQVRVLDVWLSSNPPPRPARPVPALRAASTTRRSISQGARPRPPRLSAAPADDAAPAKAPDARASRNAPPAPPTGLARVFGSDTTEDRADVADESDEFAGARDDTATGLGNRLYRRQ